MIKEGSLLLVEDQPEDIFLLKRALQKHGLAPEQLTVVEDGDQAWQYIETSYNDRMALPKLIILDINMPQRSGIALLSDMREREEFRYIPVVCLTSSTAPQDIKRCYELGVTVYLQKPMTIDDYNDIAMVLLKLWVYLRVPYKAL